jgi:hypothetical protein
MADKIALVLKLALKRHLTKQLKKVDKMTSHRFKGANDEELPFRGMMAGKNVREICHHFLAVLHLTNEEKITISSLPLVMDQVSML